MKNEKKTDQWIRDHLTSVDTPLPETVERKTLIRLGQANPATRIRPVSKGWAWAGLAAAALLAVTWLLPLRFIKEPLHKPEKISEIQTRFEIPEKNITIVWVQKEDLYLRRN